MPILSSVDQSNALRRSREEAIDLSLKVSLPEVEHTENQESACAADCN